MAIDYSRRPRPPPSHPHPRPCPRPGSGWLPDARFDIGLHVRWGDACNAPRLDRAGRYAAPRIDSRRRCFKLIEQPKGSGRMRHTGRALDSYRPTTLTPDSVPDPSPLTPSPSPPHGSYQQVAQASSLLRRCCARWRPPTSRPLDPTLTLTLTSRDAPSSPPTRR